MNDTSKEITTKGNPSTAPIGNPNTTANPKTATKSNPIATATHPIAATDAADVVPMHKAVNRQTIATKQTPEVITESPNRTKLTSMTMFHPDIK